MFTLKKLFRPRAASGVFVGRRRTRDISFLAQSPSGIIGDVTRMVPTPVVSADINDATNPVSYFGFAVMNTAQNTVRNILATDGGLTAIDGIAKRPYPFQQTTGGMNAPLVPGGLTAAPSGPLGIVRQGFIMVYCNGGQNANKKSPVCVWAAASTGTHLQGGFEIAPAATVAATATVGNTGNGTMTAGPTVDATQALAGNYTVLFTGATTFDVLAPNGDKIASGSTGKAYLAGGIGFTITAGGTAFVAGDSFTVAVTFQTITLSSKGTYWNGPGDSSGATELAFNL